MNDIHLTRWIEIACDEGQVSEPSLFDRQAQIGEYQRVHLGAAIVSLPSLIIHVLSLRSTRRGRRA
jgi:hypothetical protein